ncbi:MAG: carbohydrate kinase [Lachnospiraceae bacterium]|nr:carbohydrate kinase [Lachnospiraceae bacterium]
MDVITIGEMVIDFLPGAEKGSYIRNAGGAPANAAIAMARNGLQAGVYCKVGNDDFGRFLLSTLEENKVKPLSPELCDTATTTMAFVSLNEHNERSFTFARKPGADMMLSAEDIRDEDIEACKLVQAGSFSLSEGPAVEATKYIIRKAHELGRMVSFDINYRNVAWKDDKQACADAVMEILPYVDLLKVSDEEVDMIGGRDNIPALMKEKNISAIVETLGGDGSECFYKGTSFVHKGYKVDHVADTTGAGDAFWGGFLSRLLLLGADKPEKLTEEVLRDALDYGNVSGSLCVTAKGAISSLPTREEIESFRLKNA